MNLVFHGAEHSRFAHSMGVAHVAGLMFDAISRNAPDEAGSSTPRDKEDTVLAALLHDVGHGPFSHTLEEILKSLVPRPSFHHETMTARIIESEESEIHKILTEYDHELPGRLVPYVNKAKVTSGRWFYSIVSSQLDADRLDYLLRDAHMAGIWYRFDLRRLIDALGLKDGEIVVDVRAKDVLESFLLMLDQMYAGVYFHRAVRAASFLLKAIVQRAVELGRSSEATAKALFPEREGKDDPLWAVVSLGDQVPLDVYAALDENHVWSLISRWRTFGDPVLSDLGERIKRRQLPKVIVPGEGISKNKLRAVEDHAKKAFQKRFKDRDSKYYIGIDEPSRITYHEGDWEDDDYVALKLVTSDGKLHRIEDDKHSIAAVLKQKVYYPSLILPDEIRAEVKSYMGDMKQ